MNSLAKAVLAHVQSVTCFLITINTPNLSVLLEVD